MRVLFQAVYAITLVAAGAAGSFVWLRQIQPQLDANHILHSVSWYRAHPDDMQRDYAVVSRQSRHPRPELRRGSRGEAAGRL